ncbi:hypothetical protein B0I31_105373 [Saccharothrix carnea]|uniref:Flagellar basal body-associated protein FliL n=1 Tax=Saccharothrix carnea TaxID=1280637 RepID=A0A2P8IAC6_SACCR|nr:hypothetical protein [Saccharothrix carnea]PSL55411.1 hypothetical protein B0I31_105373 [Saccharothrix carnea]
MNWQEELRKLDEELAAGRVSADEYRTRRDQVLSAAQSVPPVQQWQSHPPSAQQPGTPDAAGASATQFIRPVGQDATPDNVDKTQVVPGGARPANPDADRTQFVPGGSMPPHQQFNSPPGGFPQQPPQSTPWASADTSAPWAAASSDNWLRQGPEVFDDTSGGGGKKVFAIVGVILVVALIGGAVWFFGFRDSSSSAGGDTTTQQTSSAAPTTTTTKPPIDLLPAGPGTPNPANGVVVLSEAVGAKLLTAEEVAAAEAAGVTEVNFKGSTEKAFTYDAMVFETGDAAKAEELATALAGLQETAGMADGAKGRLPQKSSVQQMIRKGEPGFYRCVYVTGSKVVRIGTTQTPIGVDDKELIKEFQEYGVSVVKQFPIS